MSLPQQRPPQRPPQRRPPGGKKSPDRDGGSNIDWYIVSINTIKKLIFGVAALIVLGGGGYYYYFNVLHKPIDKKAREAVEEAKEMLNKVAAFPNLPEFKSEFDQASERLTEAQKQLADKNHELALNAALASQALSKRILGTDTDTVGDAMIVDLEGSVEVQEAKSARFENAKLNTPLFVGDFVKTGNDGSADLMFTSDRSSLTVRPESLFEVKLTQDPKTKISRTTVKMSKGVIKLNSGRDPTIIQTPGSTAQLDPESIIQVDVDPARKAESFSVYQGGTRVRIGDVEETLSPQERIKIDDGKIAKTTIPLAPVLLEPPSEKIYGLADAKIKLAWNAVPNAEAYHLQISRSHLFVDNPVDISSYHKTSLKIELTEDGAYYWRVATVMSTGNSDFSAYRRLKVVNRPGPGTDGGASTPPPAPRLSAAISTQIGNTFFVIGDTDAGANITVGEEITDVKTDGSFTKIVTLVKEGEQFIVVKATSPAGVETIKRLKVVVKAEF